MIFNFTLSTFVCSLRRLSNSRHAKHFLAFCDRSLRWWRWLSADRTIAIVGRVGRRVVAVRSHCRGRHCIPVGGRRNGRTGRNRSAGHDLVRWWHRVVGWRILTARRCIARNCRSGGSRRCVASPCRVGSQSGCTGGRHVLASTQRLLIIHIVITQCYWISRDVGRYKRGVCINRRGAGRRGSCLVMVI